MVTSTREHMLQVNFVTYEYFFLNIHDVNYPLANMHKFFTRTLASETSILNLDLSAATRIHAKKGLVEPYFVVAVICVRTLVHTVRCKTN